MTNVVKTCRTCEHRAGFGYNAICMVSGYFCTTERRYPDICGVEFQRWKPRASLFNRIRQYFFGVKE